MKTENWLNPMNRVIWQKAFKRKAKTVTIRDGRKFNVRYMKRKSYKLDVDTKEIALVTPVRGFVPMGHFRMEKVLEKEWIFETSDGKRERTPSVYELKLKEFINDRKLVGVDVVEKWPDLAERDNATLVRGFNNAKTTKDIRVMTREGTVYLVKEKKS